MNQITADTFPPRVDPALMAQARVQLHHAAQVIASVGRALLPHQVDDSHTNMGWDEERQAFVSHAFAGTQGEFQVGLQVAQPAVFFNALADSDVGREIPVLPLPGITLARLHQWLDEQLCSAGFRSTAVEWEPTFEIPAHRVLTEGAAFDFSALEEATRSLAAFFDQGFSFMKAIESEHGASTPRCWPHHFDVGTLISLDIEKGGLKRSVGVGLSPGDTYYVDPYYYVSPWPTTGLPALPELREGGTWHQTDFTSAVLSAEQIHQARKPRHLVRAYLKESIDLCRSLLGDS